MLVLKRKEGQWVEITHRSGDVLRLRVYNIAHDYPGRVNLAFDDEPRNFAIQRPERFASLRQVDIAPAGPFEIRTEPNPAPIVVGYGPNGWGRVTSATLCDSAEPGKGSVVEHREAPDAHA